MTTRFPGRTPGTPVLTRHASIRLDARRLSSTAVDAVLDFGRIVRARDAEIFFVGRREVARYAREGIDLRPFEGVHVVCAPQGQVLTVYRNRVCPPPHPRRAWRQRSRR